MFKHLLTVSYHAKNGYKNIRFKNSKIDDSIFIDPYDSDAAG